MTKYLCLISSSYGHLFPAIRVAHLLQKRGKNVLIVSAREYQPLLEVYGLKNVTFTNQPHPFLSTYDWYDSDTGIIQFQLIGNIIEEFKPDVLVSSPLIMPSYICAEKYSIPLMIIGYCEYLYPSIGEQNSIKQWRIESITGYYNQLRQKLSLPVVEAEAATTPLIGQKMLLRTTPLFSDQANLPDQVEYVGSLNWEPQYVNHELNHFVSRSCQKKEPLFYVQIGRLFEEKEIWQNLIESLKRLPAAFIIDYSRADYISDHSFYPDNIYLHSFIPLGYIKDQVSGVICSGQTTMVVSAIFNGKPMLCIPNSADGKEVTERVIHHGIGQGVIDKKYLNHEVLEQFINEAISDSFDESIRIIQKQFIDYNQEEYLYDKILL